MKMHSTRLLAVALLGVLSLGISSCGEAPGSVPEVPATELAAEVAELDAVHDIMVPLWHDAFPARDFTAIQEMTPRFEPLLAALDAAELPGILQDDQASWDEGKARLLETFQGLKAAAEGGDQDGMLAYAEAFHMNYEGLVRIIRPILPELETFHQHLYGLFHYYGPGYDLEKIQRAADSMTEALVPLTTAELPSRLADQQGAFESAVESLSAAMTGFQESLLNPRKAAVEEAIDAVHTAYQGVEGIFDGGRHD